jgi:hypothetical protein
MLACNQRILERRFPELAQLLVLPPQSHRSLQWSFGAGQRCDSALVIQQEETIFPLSAIFPTAMQGWSAKFPLSSMQWVISGGFGNGAQIELFLEQNPRDCGFILVEYFKENLNAVFSRFDCSALLSNPRFFLVLPETFGAQIARMNREIAWMRAVEYMPFQPLHDLAAKYYSEVAHHMCRSLTTRWTQVNTDVSRSQICASNTYENLNNISPDQVDLAVLKERFNGHPFVLVAAGPSLDEAEDFLKSVKDRALIASVNSSHRKVCRLGVRPHLTFAVDPMETTAMGYRDTHTEDTFLVCSYFVHPEIVRRFGSRILPIGNHQPIIRLLKSEQNLPDDPALLGDGTVTATALQFAVFLGCNPIILVGQDFAVRMDGQTHTIDSFYQDLNDNKTSLSGCHWLPGNVMEKVPVQPKLLEYLRIFEALLPRLPSHDWINTSRIGAQIQGVPYMSYDSVLALPALNVSRPFSSEILNEAFVLPHPNRDVYHRLLAWLKSLQSAIEPLCISIDALVVGADARISNAEIIAQRKQVSALLEAHPLRTAWITEGMAKSVGFALARELPDYFTEDPARLSNRQLADYYWTLWSGVRFHLEKLQTHLG